MFLAGSTTATLAAILATRLAPTPEYAKLLVLWISAVSTPLLLGQTAYLWRSLGRWTPPQPEAGSLEPARDDEELGEARARIGELEGRCARLMDQLASASRQVQAAAPPEKSGREGPEVLAGFRSMLVEGGDRVRATLAGGSRLEVGVTLSGREVADVRRMMDEIGRELPRPPEEAVAETVPDDDAVRLLLVEDDKTGRRIFRAMLPKEPRFVVSECEDGHAALQALDTPPYPDIIVCDIQMPNMDGFEFLAKVRELPRLAHTPVIMASSNAYRDNVRRAGELGVCRFLRKPLDRAEVESAMRTALERRERRKSPILEAQERLCLDDEAYFHLSSGFSRAVTESITFVRSAVSRSRWQHALLRVNALRGSIHLVGDERIMAALARTDKELSNMDVSRATMELELLAQENERFMRTLVQLFAKEDSSGLPMPSPGTPQVPVLRELLPA